MAPTLQKFYAEIAQGYNVILASYYERWPRLPSEAVFQDLGRNVLNPNT